MYLDNMKIIENTYDFENVKVGKTETGRNYAIIPTKVTIIYNGQKISKIKYKKIANLTSYKT